MAHQQFKDCIDVCAVSCNHCATECLKEDDVKMLARCIQLDLECAAICRSAAELMSLGSEYSHHLCRICADVCKECGEECEKHAQMGMAHCKECAQACRRCAQACEQMATTM
jgi:hypothetical protein